MGYYDYKTGQEISAQDYPFYALIQAAMRQADTDNLFKLKTQWLGVWEDFKARYNAPSGKLPSDDVLPHPNYECSDDTCWCHTRPLGQYC